MLNMDPPSVLSDALGPVFTDGKGRVQLVRELWVLEHTLTWFQSTFLPRNPHLCPGVSPTRELMLHLTNEHTKCSSSKTCGGTGGRVGAGYCSGVQGSEGQAGSGFKWSCCLQLLSRRRVEGGPVGISFWFSDVFITGLIGKWVLFKTSRAGLCEEGQPRPVDTRKAARMSKWTANHMVGGGARGAVLPGSLGKGSPAYLRALWSTLMGIEKWNPIVSLKHWKNFFQILILKSPRCWIEASLELSPCRILFFTKLSVLWILTSQPFPFWKTVCQRQSKSSCLRYAK